MIEIQPQLTHDIVVGGRVTHVSSVLYRRPTGGTVNETRVFFSDGGDELMGLYDDHDRVVGRLLEGGAMSLSLDEMHTALDAARQEGDIELRDRLRRLILSLLMERRSR